ncbi:MAG: ABC transporter substrate-binding protein [Deltaproteobacteria bacterium]|nr:ABC transporter substrate-binding protein [Deltaproteobacteria bacterium]
MTKRFIYVVIYGLFGFILAFARSAHATSYFAYISDSTNSSVIAWVAKETGIFKKHGLELDTIFINGSVRGIQSQMNTLPYYIIGKATIKSPEGLKGRSAAVHIPGTSADFAMRLALMKVGIPYNTIKAVTVGGAPARLAAVTGGQTEFTVVTDGERIQGEKLGLRVIIDMAKLNVPFQFNCTVATRKKIRENPDEVRRVVWAMAESIHFFKTHKDASVKIMQKYTRGLPRDVLEGAHAANSELLVEDTYPTLEGLKQTLEVQVLTDPRASKAKAEDFVDLRFVDEMKKSGFVDKLYGRK